MADWRDVLPDVRDGLDRKERVVLWVLGELQAERSRGRGGDPGGRSVATAQLYGRVVEHVDMSVDELQAILQRLGALRLLPP
ncbi:MAG: hypothetical protein HYV09_00820 [Deltaproteobacteria bacterium]|nr:hypothetical protein [Deltaproteobacteria bacterium]